MRPIDPQKLHRLEETARDIGAAIGDSIEQVGTGFGFCLMLFSFEGPEATWICNVNREDVIKVLAEFQERLKRGTADELSRPKGFG